ncbi:hypothetical protein GobsT_04800 [Gemmata obscuriglobus]|uniref:Uncharacterized protein n=1 Tax=Gemmata obscuriglobus TaxID=114 RepID=A0A2Z3HHN0_9BACT|nr:hypothetical protein [Gemmata obscuriglobus]AWM40940.1 hypothetical protein C1280_30785 [Gemmata obscuriglobus]QEG25753.1 hypothetical protein GobsT_04800 [Gemmata obscuriglobus]VTR99536.1 unnamed protein product [Gemmata obscuriglobus UQM 2246]
MTGGLLLAAGLVLVGLFTGARQRQTLRALGAEPFLPDVDRAYRRGLARRRTVTSAILVLIGALIAGYYVSGMDARMDAIPERDRPALPDGADDPRPAEGKQFARLVAVYWSVVMGLVFVAVCLAVKDFWATRTYWMARYKELRADHETKLQRDLAVHRQQRLNARVPGLKPPEDDTATDEPPV